MRWRRPRIRPARAARAAILGLTLVSQLIACSGLPVPGKANSKLTRSTFTSRKRGKIGV